MFTQDTIYTGPYKVRGGCHPGRQGQQAGQCNGVVVLSSLTPQEGAGIQHRPASGQTHQHEVFRSILCKSSCGGLQ